ncbi:hypothetical protein Pyrfu_1490 [Pyrolobus fumarii 1A]|uniref:Ribbon-helix-helix protein CopG domain-containing protein n=1 Tax=Pyrolobus fumarii (strain DSM 11204 / 1A) TaxID=694429 RepID=G0EHJ5_PYRF1|nr:ribbon-helix-helix protein, CopG family [Pyrolobus fumarii]AEM39348.1 hypothetical protein Pyrfu_1490 [Pyrolobus fumarii 1A]
MAAYNAGEAFRKRDAESFTHDVTSSDAGMIMHPRSMPTVFELPAGGRKKVVSVKMESSLVEELDRVWQELGYTSRSQFIREAIVYYMVVARAVKDGNLCLCECNTTPNARRLEDVLAEKIAEYVTEEGIENDMF